MICQEVWNDDAREHIQTLPDHSVDLILTDPPYNLAKHTRSELKFKNRANINRGTGEFDTIDFFPTDWLAEFQRILKPKGNVLIFTAYNFMIDGRFACYNQPTFDKLQDLVWHKTNPLNNVFGTSVTNSCEHVIACWNEPHTYNYPRKTDGTRDTRKNHNFLAYADVLAEDVYESGICQGHERVTLPDGKTHPTQKPLKLLRQLIHQFSNPGDLIYDPFAGVMSTCVAAQQLGRQFIGVELDPIYFEAGVERLQTVCDFSDDHQELPVEDAV